MTPHEAIINVLEAQRDLYSRLHELLQRERRALVEFNHQEIEQIAKDKDALVLQVQMLEEERKRLLKELFPEEPDTKGIMDLYEVTGDERFVNLRFSLLSLLQAIQEANEVNRYFIERACHYIEGGLSFLRQYAGFDSPYGLNREV